MKRIAMTLALALCLPFTAPARVQGKAASKPATPQAATARKAEPLDINTATVDQLKTIPGIGDVYAAKIAKGRPYRAKNDLVQKKILPQGVYDKIRDRIIARRK